MISFPREHVLQNIFPSDIWSTIQTSLAYLALETPAQPYPLHWSYALMLIRISGAVLSS